MSTTESTTLLRRALSANAIFSGLCGALCLLAATGIAEMTGLARGDVLSLGVELEAFSVFLIVLATRPDLSRGWVKTAVIAVIAMDILWVVGSAVILLQASPLTVTGKWIVAAVACVVADIAYFQLRGFLGLRRSAALQPA